MSFSVESPAFERGQAIPPEHTCAGADVAPALQWAEAPPATRSFAIVMDDPDAPDGTFTHWLLWDLPAGTGQLARDAVQHATVGRNDFDRLGYSGPCPPRGGGAHRYRFRVHALDVERLPLPEGSTRREFDDALRGRVLATAELEARYERR